MGTKIIQDISRYVPIYKNTKSSNHYLSQYLHVIHSEIPKYRTLLVIETMTGIWSCRQFKGVRYLEVSIRRSFIVIIYILYCKLKLHQLNNAFII